MDFFAEVNAWTAQSDAEGACQRRLGIAGIGAQVVSVIAPCDAQGARRSQTKHQRGDDDEQSGKSRRDKIHHVVQARGKLAKVEIPFRAVSDHGVQCTDGFVGHRQGDTAEKKIEKRRHDAIAGAFRQGFEAGAQHFVLIQMSCLTPNDVREFFACSIEIAALQRRFDQLDGVEQPPRCQSRRGQGGGGDE